jgi:hypothetical protein
VAIGSEYKLGWVGWRFKNAARVLALPVNPAAGGIDGGHDRKTLLGEGSAVEIVHEDLHQGGAMKVWQARNLADYANVTEALDGLAILAVLIANQDHTVDRQLRGVQSCQGQERVVDGAHAAAGGEDYGEHEFHHHIEHELLLIDGH